MSLTLVGAITILEPDGIREPHWHPNSDEWDLVLEGNAIVTIFDGPGRSATVELGQMILDSCRETRHMLSKLPEEDVQTAQRL